jgi:glycosyltransferase involved in cell wall biosynthesis
MAVVVVVRDPGESFGDSLRSLATTCEKLEVGLVLVLEELKRRTGAPFVLPAGVLVVQAEPGDGDAGRRIRAMRATGARVLIFTDAVRIGECAWEEVLPHRLGLAQLEPADRDTLTRRLELLLRPPPASRAAAASAPLISVIVPVLNGSRVLPRCLESLTDCNFPREAMELIVVDDASTDLTPAVAAEWADVIVRLPGTPRGPAYARNRGADVAVGELFAFVDADQAVHPEALARLCWSLVTTADAAAVSGLPDASPAARNLVSQYRHLWEHEVHQIAAGETQGFWAGCGVVRRDAFRQAGGFDEWHFPRPQIEDWELGARLRNLGYKVVADSAAQATSLRRWTLRSLLRAHLFDRGIPWIRLLLQQGDAGHRPLKELWRTRWVNTGLVWLALILVPVALVTSFWPALAAAALAILLVFVLDWSTLQAFRQHRNLAFVIRILPLHFATYLMSGAAAIIGLLLHHLVGAPGPPPDIQAFAEKGLKVWPPLPSRSAQSPWLAGPSPTVVTSAPQPWQTEGNTTQTPD